MKKLTILLTTLILFSTAVCLQPQPAEAFSWSQFLQFTHLIHQAQSGSVASSPTPTPSPTPADQMNGASPSAFLNSRVQALANKLETQFASHQEKLQKLVELAQKRSDRLQRRGKDVTTVKADLEKTQQDLDTANQVDDVAVSKVRAIRVINNKIDKDDLRVAQDQVRLTQQDYVQVVQDLRQVIQDFKNTK